MKRANIITGLLAAATLTPLTAIAEEPSLSITDIVVASGGTFDNNLNDFDILLNAVLAAGLEGALADPHADLTVFAPTDKAFVRLARDLGMVGGGEAAAFDTIVAALTALGDGDLIPVLTNILLYHVSAGAQTSTEVLHAPYIDTLLDGATLLPVRSQLVDNEPDLRNGKLINGASDIVASNGIIHAINRVLIPLDIDNTDNASLPTLTALALASGGEFDHNGDDFDILLNAVLTAGLADALNNPSDSLTVLAPNDAAFIRTARELGFHGDDEAGAFGFIVETLTALGEGDPIPLLTSILLYHVVPEALQVKDVILSESLDTLLSGASIHPDAAKRLLGDNDPDIRDPRVMVSIKKNIRASNGWLHSISRVLIPIDL